MKAERTVELEAPPERVYDIVMDPRCLKDWVTIHQKLESAPNGQLQTGSTITQVLKLAGRKFKVRWTVIEVKPCERVVWEGDGPMFTHARVVYDFAPHGEGTRFSYTNEYDLPGGALGRVAGRGFSGITEKALDDSLQKLKSIVG